MGKKDYSEKYYYRYKYFNNYQNYSYNNENITNKEYYNYYNLYENYIDYKKNNYTKNPIFKDRNYSKKDKLYKPPPGLPPPPPPPSYGNSSIFQRNTDRYRPRSSSIPKLFINNKKDSSTSTSTKDFDSGFFSSLIPFSSIFSELDKKVKETEEKVNNITLELTKEEKEYEFELLEEKIENIDDLIKLGKKYKTTYKDKKKRYNINLKVLEGLVEPLEDLSKMIGMENIKKAIFNKIILYLQGLENKNTDYNHIVLCGGPGMGKTHVAKIIGKIYTKLGFLSKGEFKEVKLTDLKAGYLGQTEIKTQKLLDESKGSILFFDEAYSLGSEKKFDSFSQSIIDVINPFLDKYKNDFIFIIAGYKKDLEERFFRGNQGLKSRFGLWLEIEKYKPCDLNFMFRKKIKDYEWSYKETEIKDEFFRKNMDCFEFYGRDIENLFAKCKIAHAKRVLFCKPEEKKIINLEDLENGFSLYKEEGRSSVKDKSNLNLDLMYV